MTHDYKYENLREEDRNSLLPAVRRGTGLPRYDDDPNTFDGPQPRTKPAIKTRPLEGINTEGDE